MVYIGIDISKYKHDCFIDTETGISFSFENSILGFKKMLEKFKHFNKSEMMIGLEATGHYGNNLKSFLSSHGYSFMELNPFLVSKFNDQRTLRKLKTDKTDAKLIAAYIASVDFKAYHHQSYHILALKSLTRMREGLVSERTMYFNLITTTLDVTFPEFKPFFSKQGYSATSLYILKHYTTAEKIAKLTDKHYEIIRKVSSDTFKYPNFVKLKDIAATTIGVSSDYLVFKLLIYISYVEKLIKDIKDVERRIKTIMSEHPTYFQSIPGLGTIKSAIILAEYGDLSLFSSASKMVSFAGLESTIKESGTSKTVGKLSKRGSVFLRTALINSALCLISHNKAFCAYYNIKKKQGKHHRVASVHLAKKLIRVIYHLEKNKVYFDPELSKYASV